MQTKNTNALQKLSLSIINTFFVVLISLPFYFLFSFNLTYKIILVLIFLLNNISFYIFNKKQMFRNDIIKYSLEERLLN